MEHDSHIPMGPRGPLKISGLLTIGVLTIGLLISVGCTATIPPPAVPPTTPPVMEEMPALEEGRGRVIFDTVDGPADVYEVVSHSVAYDDKVVNVRASHTSTELLCTTPCAIDLELGRHVLAFPMLGGTSRMERDVLNVGRTPVVYRRALGSYDRAGAGMILGVLGATFGGIAMVVGAVFLPLGLARGEDGATIAGGINLGVGTALLVAGILGIVSDPNVEQPGSRVVFPLESAPRGAR